MMGAGVLFHLKTAYLFVRSDIKTILFPVSGFAFMASKDIWTTRSILVLVWVLTHLFLIDIDNQSLSVDEDKLNKPWRPLPSGRVTISTAKFLSKTLNAICLLVSCLLGGRELMIPTVVFCGLVYSYDHLLLNSHYIWKNIINGLGYAVLETGATTVLIGSLPRKPNMILALVLSWAIICTTVHVQDLADIEGDQKNGAPNDCYTSRTKRHQGINCGLPCFLVPHSSLDATRKFARGKTPYTPWDIPGCPYFLSAPKDVRWEELPYL